MRTGLCSPITAAHFTEAELSTKTEPLTSHPQSAVLESVLTCPNCGCAKRETMPTDACQFFYQCENCMVLLRPNSGDCCVFCSFGSVKCPPVQLQRVCYG